MNLWFVGIVAVLLFVIYWSFTIISSMAEQLLTFRQQIANLSAALKKSNSQLAWYNGTGAMPQPNTTNVLPIDLVNKLIRFCHPDRHANNPKAGMITAER